MPAFVLGGYKVAKKVVFTQFVTSGPIAQAEIQVAIMCNNKPTSLAAGSSTVSDISDAIPSSFPTACSHQHYQQRDCEHDSVRSLPIQFQESDYCIRRQLSPLPGVSGKSVR